MGIEKSWSMQRVNEELPFALTNPSIVLRTVNRADFMKDLC